MDLFWQSNWVRLTKFFFFLVTFSLIVQNVSASQAGPVFAVNHWGTLVILTPIPHCLRGQEFAGTVRHVTSAAHIPCIPLPETPIAPLSPPHFQVQPSPPWQSPPVSRPQIPCENLPVLPLPQAGPQGSRCLDHMLRPEDWTARSHLYHHPPHSTPLPPPPSAFCRGVSSSCLRPQPTTVLFPLPKPEPSYVCCLTLEPAWVIR